MTIKRRALSLHFFNKTQFDGLRLGEILKLFCHFDNFLLQCFHKNEYGCPAIWFPTRNIPYIL